METIAQKCLQEFWGGGVLAGCKGLQEGGINRLK